MYNGHKYVLIPFREWNRLENEIQASKTINERILTLPLPRFKYKSTSDLEEKSNKNGIPAVTGIQNVTQFTKFVFQKENNLPIDLRRAMFLSNVFTEKANQLEFVRLLRKIHEQKQKAEKDKMKQQEREYQAVKRENKINEDRKKFSWGRTLQDELQKNKKREAEVHRKEIKKEREDILQIIDELRKTQREVKTQELEKKKDLKKLFLNDQREKQEYRKRHPDEGRYENKCVLSQSPPKDKICNVRNVCENLFSKKKMPTNLGINSLLISKKSHIEIKREMYEKKLKEERIRMNENQIREKMNSISRENDAEKIEYEQRLQNLALTNTWKNTKHREHLEKIMANRNIWNKQCIEKKSKYEKERLEDKERLLKLQKDMRKEDEEFIRDVHAILREFDKQGKNTLPIVKCIKEFEKNKIPESKLPQY